jgi:hypothetical protein
LAINPLGQFVDQSILDKVNNTNTSIDPASGLLTPAATRQQSNATDVQTVNRSHFFRSPFTMDCVSWRLEKRKSIIFRCNPNKVDYEWPIRGATQNVKSGKVFYFWRNKDKRSHFDLPAVTFGFQSGNIVVLSDNFDPNESPKLYVPEGLDNFHQFMSIVDEKKMLSDGTPNFITITHHSAIFPNLSLTGFFDPSSPITVSESVEEPSLITWSGKFLVHTSEPRFNSAAFAKTFGTVFMTTRNYVK